jgi:multicomponent Na+:H+ antiporter subunit A
MLILVIILAVPILTLIPLVLLGKRLLCANQGQILGLVMAGLFGASLWLLPQVQDQQALQFSLPWVPQLGLTFSLYLDGLALLFVLLVTGMAGVIMLYAGYYFEDPLQSARFYNLILVFISSMLGLVMAGNLITLFIAWELTSVISFLLISFKGSDAEARSGALQALMITGAGGLALFAGLLLMGSAAGSMQLADILAGGDVLRSHPWYSAMAILVMVGCFSKSAQFPLHFWLPGAMSAPTPASAFLHSATMVKAGIYLLLRLYPVLGDTPLWENSLLWVGGLTSLITALIAMWQMDLKGILAYSTISQLGSLVLLIGLPGGAGIKAALIGVLAHALYKGTLFLVVGAVDHYTGTRNIRELGGLAKYMPGYALIAAVVVLSMAGVPPMFGFVAKEAALEALLNQPLALAGSLARAVLTAAIAFRLFWDVFLRPPRVALPVEEHREHDFHHPLGDDAFDYSHAHDIPAGMVIGPALTAAASLALGLGISPILTPLISASLGKATKLYLFPPGGFNLALGLSLGALAVGLGIFLVRRHWVRWQIPEPMTGRRAYTAIIGGVETLGDWLLGSQNGKIRYYLSAIMLTVVALL